MATLCTPEQTKTTLAKIIVTTTVIGIELNYLKLPYNSPQNHLPSLFPLFESFTCFCFEKIE